jgi:hypothetical protein
MTAHASDDERLVDRVVGKELVLGPLELEVHRSPGSRRFAFH